MACKSFYNLEALFFKFLLLFFLWSADKLFTVCCRFIITPHNITSHYTPFFVVRNSIMVGVFPSRPLTSPTFYMFLLFGIIRPLVLYFCNWSFKTTLTFNNQCQILNYLLFCNVFTTCDVYKFN